MAIFDIFRKSKPQQRKWTTNLPSAPNALPNVALSPPDAEFAVALDKLKAQSRHEIKSGGLARGYLVTLQKNILGSKGLTLKSENAQVQEAWEDYIARGDVDATEELDWTSLQHMVLSELIADGECLVKIIHNQNHPYGLQIKILDTALLSTATNGRVNSQAGKNHTVSLGVERDQNGKVVAYHISPLPFNSGSLLLTSSYSAETRTVRVPSELILHVYQKLQPLSSRGAPWLAAALIPIANLRLFEQSELGAARLSARTLGFITQSGTENQEWTPPSDDDDEQPKLDTKNGAINQLAVGEGFQAWQPQHPVNSYEAFCRSQKETIASAAGISYAALSQDLSNTSFSSARVGLIGDMEFYAMARQLLISKFHQPLFERFVFNAIAKGQLPMPRDGNIAALTKARWIGKPLEHVQPREQARAAAEYVKLGIKTPSEYIRESGRNPSEVFEEALRDHDTLRILSEKSK